MDERVTIPTNGEAGPTARGTTDPAGERVLRDQSGRDLITTALDTNVMVLAGAGAGKTHALIERMVAAVRHGFARVDRMAAITFTRKAAGEMRGRFVVRLRDSREEARPDDERRRIDEALRDIDQCFIGTIHSFCGRLLRERPLEAGLSPDFIEVDDRQEALLRRETWDAFVQKLFAQEDPRIHELASYGLEPEDLYRFFGRRCDFADLELKPTETQRPDLEASATEVVQFVSRVRGRIPTNPEKRDGLMYAVRKAHHFLSNHGVKSNTDRATLLGFFDRALSVTLKHWGKERAFARELRDDLLPQLQGKVVEPALRKWRESAYRIVAEIVDDAMSYYDGVRLERGTLTFQDLLLRTERLLRDSSEVRRYFQRRYPTILVDEFQDTDPIQAAIVMYLTAQDLGEKNWRKIRPRPGSLFLVGDDKQSIYRFRRADVEIFRQMRDCIREAGGEIVHLNTSFRSLGRLCKWINSSFPAIFDEPSRPYQADFEPLFEHRPEGSDETCIRKISIPGVERHRRERILSHDSVRIASFIAAAIEGRTPLNTEDEDGMLAPVASPGDFMILTRTATQIASYARELESLGIPYDIVGGGRISDSAEFRALVSVLETIYTPDNPLPFLIFLRGPLVGLADDDLYDFRRAGGSFHYRAVLPEELNSDLANRLERALALLREAEDALSSRPAASAVEWIIDRAGLLAYAGVHPDGQSSSRAGGLLRTLSLVRGLHAQGRHWGEITEELIQLRDDPTYDLEEMTLETGREDVVRLMNVHQAKGLQAKVVFLADPYDCSPYRYRPESHVSRGEGHSFLSMVVGKKKGDFGSTVIAQPAGWKRDCEEEARYEAAEEMRLLYVAATRARNLLVVSRYEGNPGRGPWHRLYPCLKSVPELERPEQPSDALMAGNGRSAISEWMEARDQLPERLEKAARPSYSMDAVTDDVLDIATERAGGPGRGREYGVIVHRMLEDAVHRRVPTEELAYAEKIVLEAGLDGSHAADAIAVLGRFRRSDVWRELGRADRVYTEVPVGRAAAGQRPEITRGVIDLVYRLDGAWHIVDYKTDTASTRHEAELLLRKYDRQVNAYRRYWEEITGEEVRSARIWLAHGPTGGSHQLALFQN